MASQVVFGGLAIQPISVHGTIYPSLTYKNRGLTVVVNQKDGGTIWAEKWWTF